MMRVVMTFFWGLLAVWLVTEDLGAQSPTKKKQAQQPKVVNNANVANLTATGYGLDIETAKRDALKQAQKELKNHLRTRKPPIQYWVPSESFISKNLLDGPGSQGEDVQVRDDELAKTWILKVRTPSATDAQRMEALAKQQADQRLRETSVIPRLLILGKILAAIVVLLLAVVGYLHLEEKTRGVYTHLLRVGMICLVAAGAGILFWA